jgi:hypothetical protein
MGLCPHFDLTLACDMKHRVMPSPAKTVRDDFIAWQCRIRQIAMRQDGGRPSPGTRPRVLDVGGRELAPALTVLILPRDPTESTDFFRFQVLKTADPRDLYEHALAYLQADYFQRPSVFGDVLTAVVPPQSELATKLLHQGRCVLAFKQFSQRFRLRCAVFETEPREAIREATLWHNRLFNPSLPDEVLVLGFRPGWKSAEA